MTIVLTHALVAGTKSLFFVYELGVWPGAGVNVTSLKPPPHTDVFPPRPEAGNRRQSRTSGLTDRKQK